MYIQIFNKDGQPVFIDMQTGKACWILPSGTSLGSVQYMSHFSEETGHPYYEKLNDNAVSWSLPTEEMAQPAQKKVTSILSMSLLETQKELKEVFDFEKSSAQMVAIDDYILFHEEGDVNDTIDSLAKSKRNDVYVSSDEDDAPNYSSSSAPRMPVSKDHYPVQPSVVGEDNRNSINSNSTSSTVNSAPTANKPNALQMIAQRKLMKGGSSTQQSTSDGLSANPVKQNTGTSNPNDSVESSHIKTPASALATATAPAFQQSPGFLFKIDEVDESDEDAVIVTKVNRSQQKQPESESTSTVAKGNQLSTTKPTSTLAVAPPPPPTSQQKRSSSDSPVSSPPPPPPPHLMKKIDSNLHNSSNSAQIQIPLAPAPPPKGFTNEKKPPSNPTPPPPPPQPLPSSTTTAATLSSSSISSTSNFAPPPPPPGAGESLLSFSSSAIERKTVPPENIRPDIPVSTSFSEPQELGLTSSVDTGAVIAGKLFANSEGNKPAVRLVFDAYMKENKTIDAQVLQDLCYDFGTFYSMHEIKITMRKYCNKSSNFLTYENFMVWWRSESKMNSVKLTDPSFKRKIAACEYFKRADPQRNGFITVFDYSALHPKLIDAKIISSSLSVVDCIPLLVEKTFNQQSGEQLIQFADYISWIETVETGADGNKKTTFKKIVSGIRRASMVFKTPSKEATTAMDGSGKKAITDNNNSDSSGQFGLMLLSSNRDKSGNDVSSSLYKVTEQNSSDDDDDGDDSASHHPNIRLSNRVSSGDGERDKINRSRSSSVSDDDHDMKARSPPLESKVASGSAPATSRVPNSNNALRQALLRRQSMKKTPSVPVKKEPVQHTDVLSKSAIVATTTTAPLPPKKAAVSVQGIFGTIHEDSADDDDDDDDDGDGKYYSKKGPSNPVKGITTGTGKGQSKIPPSHQDQTKVAEQNGGTRNLPYQNNMKRVGATHEQPLPSQPSTQSPPTNEILSNDALSYQDKIKKFRQAEQAQDQATTTRKPSPQPLKHVHSPPDTVTPPPPPAPKSSALDIEQAKPFQQKAKPIQVYAEKKITMEDALPKSKLNNPILFRPSELDDEDEEEDTNDNKSPNSRDATNALPRRNSKTRLRAIRAKSAAASTPPPPPPKRAETPPSRSDTPNRSVPVTKSFSESTDSTSSSNEKLKSHPEFLKDEKLQATVTQLRNALSSSNIQLKKTPDLRPQLSSSTSSPDQNREGREPSPAKERFEALKNKFAHPPPPPPRQPSPIVRAPETVVTVSVSEDGMRQVDSPIKKMAAKVAFQLPDESFEIEPEIVSPQSLPPAPPSTTKQKLRQRLSSNIINRDKAKEQPVNSSRSTPSPPKFRWNESIDYSIDDDDEAVDEEEEEIFSPVAIKPLKVLKSKLSGDAIVSHSSRMSDFDDEGPATEHTPTIFSTPQDQHQQYTLFQQLLRERADLVTMRKELEAAEEASMKRIADAEAASKHRMQGLETATQANIAQRERTAQWMMTKMVSEHQQRVKAERTVLANERSALAEASERFNTVRRLGEEQLATLAKQLCMQQQKQQLERKQLLRQRFHLDVALQNLNSIIGGGPSLVVQKINMLGSASGQGPDQDQEQHGDDNISMVTSVNSSTQGGYSRVRSIRSGSSTSPTSVYSSHDFKLSHSNSAGANVRRSRAISPTTVLRTVSPAPLLRQGSVGSRSGLGLGSRSLASLTLSQPQNTHHHIAVSAPIHAYTGSIPPSLSSTRRSADDLILSKPPFK